MPVLLRKYILYYIKNWVNCTFIDACATQEVYTGEDNFQQPHIEDTQTCFVTLNEVLKCVISLEQDHMQYRKNKQRNTVIGSVWVY